MLLKPIFLIGMPGTGKTFWAGHLGRYFQCPYFDLDKEITAMIGGSIVDFFETKGEPAFRKLESEVLQKIISENTSPYVLATGGGTPCFFDNMALMKSKGWVVYLKAHLNTLILRLQKNYHQRPLLKDDLVGNTTLLLEQRAGIYDQADMIISVENLTAPKLKELLEPCIKLPS